MEFYDCENKNRLVCFHDMLFTAYDALSYAQPRFIVSENWEGSDEAAEGEKHPTIFQTLVTTWKSLCFELISTTLLRTWTHVSINTNFYKQICEAWYANSSIWSYVVVFFSVFRGCGRFKFNIDRQSNQNVNFIIFKNRLEPFDWTNVLNETRITYRTPKN